MPCQMAGAQTLLPTDTHYGHRQSDGGFGGTGVIEGTAALWGAREKAGGAVAILP